MVYASGTKVVSSIGVMIGLTRGLPKIIPGSLRLRIEGGDRNDFRVVLTILSLFRILEAKSVTNLGTITSPFSGFSPIVPLSEVASVRSLLPSIVVQKDRDFKYLSTAGPNHRISSYSAPLDTLAFDEYPEVLNSFKYLCRKLHQTELLGAFEKEKDLMSVLKDTKPIDKNHYILGKLSKKIEPAGKVRIFAITD